MDGRPRENTSINFFQQRQRVAGSAYAILSTTYRLLSLYWYTCTVPFFLVPMWFSSTCYVYSTRVPIGTTNGTYVCVRTIYNYI
jgi:hypothetical protein